MKCTNDELYVVFSFSQCDAAMVNLIRNYDVAEILVESTCERLEIKQEWSSVFIFKKKIDVNFFASNVLIKGLHT